MKKNKTTALLIALLTLSCSESLTSCSNKESEKWAYTKDDMTRFISMSAIQKDNQDKTITFSADTDVPIFDEKIDLDDVIAFDVNHVKKELESSGKDYADYSVLKKAAVDVVNVENLDDQDGFHITFKGESSSSSEYAMLLHSSVSTSDNYVMVNQFTDKNENGNKDPQAEFEEKYVTKHCTWEDGGKFMFQVVTNVAVMIAGAASDNPAAFMSGLFGIVSSIGENCSDKDATIKGVMDLLKETDRKVEELSNKIDRNTQLLQDEIVRVNANVDQANLNTLNLAINDFANNALSPITTFNRNLADAMGEYYKDFITKPEKIKLVLSKSGSTYGSTPLCELNDSSVYNFEITLNDFSNAKKFLSSNGNIVKNGFVAELSKDIDSALATATNIPEGLTKESLNDFIRSRIIENFTKEYFSKNKEKAQTYRNLMIEYAERVSGLKGKVSYLTTYLSRLQFMYNFQGEIKNEIRAFCTNLLKTLDMNTALATQACFYAGYDYDELSTVYKSTREKIQNFYETNAKEEDSYSFIAQSALTGGFYQSKYNTSFSNLGNECSLKVTFQTQKVEMKNGAIVRTDEEISKHSGISESNHLRISTRWNLLRKTGSIQDVNDDYIHYLSSNSVISSNAIEACEFLCSAKQADQSSYRILTSSRNERDLNGSDSSLKMKCVGRGNPNGDYFKLDQDYNYRSSQESSCWSGKTFEGSFLSALSGSSLGTEKIASYAKYAESHWYWKNDEHWSFINDEKNNYYFIIESVQKK